MPTHQEHAAERIRAVMADLPTDCDAAAYLHDAAGEVDAGNWRMALELIDDAAKANGAPVAADLAMMRMYVNHARDNDET